SIGSALISSSVRVLYRDNRLCSGATFPVLLANCHGGSARMVAKRWSPTNPIRSIAGAATERTPIWEQNENLAVVQGPSNRRQSSRVRRRSGVSALRYCSILSPRSARTCRLRQPPRLRVPIIQKPERLRLGVVEHGGAERAAHYCCGVEVGAPAAQLGGAGPQRGVAVHDEAPAITPVAIGEKRLAHPHHHLGRLLGKRQVEIDAGVDEEAQPVVVAERQRREPVEMLRRNAAAAVIAQRAGAIVGEPQRHPALARLRGGRHPLVVAAQA